MQEIEFNAYGADPLIDDILAGVAPPASVSIEYTVADDHGRTSTATATFLVGSEGALATHATPSADTLWVDADSPAYWSTTYVLSYEYGFTGTPLVTNIAAQGGTQTSVLPNQTTVLSDTYGALSIDQDGLATYAPDTANAVVMALDEGDTLYRSFTYTVTDDVRSYQADLVVAVHGVNDAPVGKNDSATTSLSLGGQVSGNVLSNDTDPDLHDTLSVVELQDAYGNPFQIGVVAQGQYGTLTLNADGSYAYQIDPNLVAGLASNYKVPDQFTYALSDGSLLSYATLLVNVADNLAPVVSAATPIHVQENAWVDIGNLLQAVNASDPEGAQLSIVNPSYYLEPSSNSDGHYFLYTFYLTQGRLMAGEVQTYTLNFGVSDGSNVTYASIDVIVTGIDDPPFAAPQDKVIAAPAGSPVDVGLIVVDVDSSPPAGTVQIYQLPDLAGTLMQNGAAIHAGDTIAIADLDNLSFEFATAATADDFFYRTSNFAENYSYSGSVSFLPVIDGADNVIDASHPTYHSPRVAHLVGGSGNDTFRGFTSYWYGNGIEALSELSGGDGSDHFEFATPQYMPSHITDFTSGSDTIDLVATGFGLTSGLVLSVVEVAEPFVQLPPGDSPVLTLDNAGDNAGTLYLSTYNVQYSYWNQTLIGTLDGVMHLAPGDVRVI